MSAQIVQFPAPIAKTENGEISPISIFGADIDLAACKEDKERRTARAVKGWETRRRNGWQGRAKSRSDSEVPARGAALGGFLARAVKLLSRMPSHSAECWLSLAEAHLVHDDDGGAA